MKQLGGDLGMKQDIGLTKVYCSSCLFFFLFSDYETGSCSTAKVVTQYLNYIN